jgi:CRP-like cAMP-binding protein
MTFHWMHEAMRDLELHRMKQHLSTHPRRHFLGLQLARHPLLCELEEAALAELVELLEMHDTCRGERMLEQGSRELRQYFVLEGLLKRMVTSPQGREMTLRFAGEGDFETCYDAWRRHEAVSYSVVCAASGCVASLPMSDWCGFLARHPQAQQVFQDRVVALGQTLVDHAVGLLLLDAPSRVDAFSRRHPHLVGRLVQKDLASHLNLSAETLCRLWRRTELRQACA